jgi:protein-disulfide isomerase
LVGWKNVNFSNSGATGKSTESPAAITVETGVSPAQAACEYDPSSSLSVPSGELVSFQDAMEGNPDANVTVVEFFDPNCSHCQAFHPVMKKVLAEYHDQIKFYAIPFPLWKYSVNQVEAMVLADRQDKFYEMIDIQLAQGVTRGMSDEQLIALADSIDLDTETFAEALRNDEARRRALYYAQRGREIGIKSTPTVAINGRVVDSNSRTVECLGQLIDQELAQGEN